MTTNQPLLVCMVCGCSIPRESTWPSHKTFLAAMQKHFMTAARAEMARSTGVFLTIAALIVVTLEAVADTVSSEDTTSGSGSGIFTTPEDTEDMFKLHVNPADPIIMSVETSDGDTMYMVGNKTSDGLPQSIDEFQVENEEGTTYVTLGTDGSVTSAINTDGLQLEFIWGENFTTLHASLVFGNSSEQVSMNIDLSESIDGNFTDFNEDVRKKRNANREQDVHQTKSMRTKRQTGSQNFANILISVKSCDLPERNARVFADVLFDYEDAGSHGNAMKYTGVKTQIPGQYNVHIPVRAASDIGEKVEMICDQIEMFLGKVCDTYSKVNNFVRRFSKLTADKLICFALAIGLKHPAVYRFCQTAFKAIKSYCKYANKDLGFGVTPAKLFCDTLPLIDRGINILRQKSLLFTPSALFPRGNVVTAQGRVLRISPGSSTVNEVFTIKNDQNKVRITHFSVSPFDPAPYQSYSAIASYECYSSNINVHMSITGTDGFTGWNTCTTGPRCVLYIPGAPALVRDTITVTIRDIDTAIVRRISIIF